MSKTLAELMPNLSPIELERLSQALQKIDRKWEACQQEFQVKIHNILSK